MANVLQAEGIPWECAVLTASKQPFIFRLWFLLSLTAYTFFPQKKQVITYRLWAALTFLTSKVFSAFFAFDSSANEVTEMDFITGALTEIIYRLPIKPGHKCDWFIVPTKAPTLASECQECFYLEIRVQREQLPSSQKTTQEQSTSILYFVWIRRILDQFCLLVVHSIFLRFDYSDCFLLPVLKGWENGLQYIIKDGFDYGKEEVIASCLWETCKKMPAVLGN